MRSQTVARGSNFVAAVCASVAFAASFGAATSTAAEPIDFRRDIQPILSNHCWSCHGVDETSRKGGMRLDVRESATSPADSGLAPIVPDKPDESELIARITAAADDSSRMPPASFKKPLSDGKKELLRRWIAEGARYDGHWAFSTPERTDPPEVKQADWPRNDIDRFILHRIEAEGLKPSPETERAAWLRRVTLDLTGLPPTTDELAAFLGDSSPDAFETVVDRLLQSPAHAERMAVLWLDSARYADTNGYNNDETRSMWPWRNWVISAYASGMPYDQFLTEQLAGDLLPNATLSQRVATGFNRNHVVTTEGGVIQEEYRCEYVADRVHTAATVFMALSMQCARCHDHKFDPITQRDYYRFSAFFSNVPDALVSFTDANLKGTMPDPVLKAPSPEQQAELERLAAHGNSLQAALDRRAVECDGDLVAWMSDAKPEDVRLLDGDLQARFLLDETDEMIAETPAADASGANSSPPEAAFTVADSLDPRRRGTVIGARSVAGKTAGGFQFDGNARIEVADLGDFEADQPFTLAAWFFATSTEPGAILSKMDDASQNIGYDVILEQSRMAVHFSSRWPESGFKLITKATIPQNEWHHVAVTFSGSKEPGGTTIYIDGRRQDVDVSHSTPVTGSIRNTQPFRMGRRSTGAGFVGTIDDVLVYKSALSEAEIAALVTGGSPQPLTEALSLAAGQRTPEQQAALRRAYLERVDPESKRLRDEMARTVAQTAAVEASIPYTMVMSEMEPRRKTYILKRGEYDAPGDEVTAGAPETLFPWPIDAPDNRLGLARWLTDPKHPLTSRVAVNRLWEMMFGTGLVETSEDFGIQGSQPTHPELLDWLATELVRGGWSQRHILRLIAVSATYRQSSAVSPELHDLDPRNKLLARSPRYRISAEMVRDQALAVSGLLVAKIGGPSVKPYQPEGLWEDVSVERREVYRPDPGDGLYRRSLYTFWKRTCPPPSMATLDAPDRETCVVRRARTNTPLQALMLLNDPTYVEASRKLAERAIHGGNTDEARLSFAWKTALSREPDGDEQRVFLDVLSLARTHFGTKPDEAERLLSVGQSPRDAAVAAPELAAWTTIMSMLLNLDEMVSKP
jgi:cytochrome c553